MGTRKRVVVTGIGIICGLGNNKQEVLAKMKENQTGIAKMERFDTSKFISQMGAEVKAYEAESYFSPDELARYDRCAQYAIIAAQEALEDTHVSLDSAGRDRMGVALGTCNGGINSLEVQWTVEGLDKENTAKYPFFQQGDAVAKHFDLHGPVNTINTACAASGNAVGFASDMVAEGYADMMLAGGSDPMSISVYAGFNVLQALNPEPCSPYNIRYGLSLGEGAAFVVLESLESALQRGAKIYAEVNGYGLSSDAYHETAPEPEGRGIQHAVELALKTAEIDKTQVGYINTHGTGTAANDSAELFGLRKLFGEEQFSKLPISSSKAYFGHNLGAAAAIEYVTTLLAMQQGLLPATLHFEAPRKGSEDANLIVNSMREEKPEFFLCNNSAFGGHNCSIVSRNWKQNQATDTERSRNHSRVVISGMGMVHHHGYETGSILPWLSRTDGPVVPCEFDLKAYDKNLYERRMNSLTQFSIGATHLALQDAGWEEADVSASQVGLIYGTSRGSLQSAQKYLDIIFNKGPEFASGIYFPDMVLNSTAGKMAKKLKLKGYGTSLSTGGNDGLMSALYGYETIKNNIQTYCLVGAGDERSELSATIDRALGLDQSPFQLSEGGASLLLSNLESAQQNGMKVYAELSGFGLTFSASEQEVEKQLHRAVNTALEHAGLRVEDVDFVLFSSAGLPHTAGLEQDAIDSMFGKQNIPNYCFNDVFGYGESTSALYHLYVAADMISSHQNQQTAWQEVAAAGESLSANQRFQHGLVVGSSINGNNIAVVVSAVN
ncbi:beta-ketoacyl-[acyl-carrier-protein] synthase family protein [Tumebacillus permanentifrigoris]|uniref:3-oxoacyl-[acyl-carrier-protein] synthase II n=1 Tax=Tumebacillus permanentifrigoris TaxID=378543 RepID=A0A316D542_9BACL|nr:beta-ketoacyl-[acyl-carrier-protein] synthase family protein [Tumebacillus permanentifrigoris]PWK07437.1 3-oxoacyl-[acyl-carrier-protein] synthase II [Tumebacillus permanentifrigoris]